MMEHQIDMSGWADVVWLHTVASVIEMRPCSACLRDPFFGHVHSGCSKCVRKYGFTHGQQPLRRVSSSPCVFAR